MNIKSERHFLISTTYQFSTVINQFIVLVIHHEDQLECF